MIMWKIFGFWILLIKESCELIANFENIANRLLYIVIWT